MAENVETRIVVRSFKINTYSASQLQPGGNINEHDSIEPTGHRQVSIQYDKKLFRVVDESGTLLEEITVDEGVVDLLKAFWKHGIPTNRSCQGGNGEMAWISFESFEDAGHFLDLVPLSQAKTWNLNTNKDKKNFEVSFPQEDVAKITEELNKTVAPQLI